MISITKINDSEIKSLFKKEILINKNSLSIPITNKSKWNEIKNNQFEINRLITKSFI